MTVITETLHRQLLSLKGGTLSECVISLEYAHSQYSEFRIDALPGRVFRGFELFINMARVMYALEQEGYLLLCNMARADTHTTGMLGGGSFGRRAFIWTIEPQTRTPQGRGKVVDILDPIEPALAVPLAEHAHNFRLWGLGRLFAQLEAEKDSAQP